MKPYNPEHRINTPIGKISVPGFHEAEAMGDDALVEQMNAAPFVDPVVFHVASRRFSLVHDYCHSEGRFRWWTREDYENRSQKSRQRGFTAIVGFLAGNEPTGNQKPQS